MNTIEPRKISREELITSFKEGSLLVFSNALSFTMIWMPLLLLMILSIEIRPLIFFILPLTFVTVISNFEMACTLYVGYKGSTLEKVKVSYKAALNTTKNYVFKVDFVWLGILFMIFILPLFNVYLSKEDVNVGLFVIVLSYFCSFIVSCGFNTFNIMKWGIISMYAPDGQRDIVVKLHALAFLKNVPVAFICLGLSFVALLLGSVCSWLFPIISSIFVTSSFFMFIKIFEPPMLKQQEKEHVDITNIVPESQ